MHNKLVVLVTGGSGFIGCHYLDYLLQNNPDSHVINLDKLSYASSAENTKIAEQYPNYTFVQGDIVNADLLKSLFEQYNINSVVHFAAESHVDNSISGPEAFIMSNIVGTFQLLEAARQAWKGSALQENRFVYVSTDEVYGSLGKEGFFTEQSRIEPNSPYSATKASGDCLVRSYYKTYGMNTLTTHCSNNYGPRQHHEKLIPTIIRSALNHKPIPIYGNGQNVRDWIFVLDHVNAIDKVRLHGEPGAVYNIGGECEESNLSMAKIICQILDILKPKSSGSYEQQIKFVEDRAGHDYRYAIANSNIYQTGWKLQHTFPKALEETVQWYVTKEMSSQSMRESLPA